MAKDVEIVAEPNGNEMIYWTGQRMEIAGASALLISVDVMKITGSLVLRVLGQYICFDLRKEKLASGVKPYTDVTYNCGTIGCFPNVKP